MREDEGFMFFCDWAIAGQMDCASPMNLEAQLKHQIAVIVISC